MVSEPLKNCLFTKSVMPNFLTGSRGPAVLDDFTSSYGYKFSDAAGYQWPTTQNAPNKL
jgi:glucose-6-phosphate 1-dehydrogenase